MTSEKKKFLVILRLADASASRLVELVPALQRCLDKLSSGDMEQVFRSTTADVFGYFIQTKLNSGQILAAIESPGRSYSSEEEPFLSGADSVFVMDIGPDFQATRGFSRPMTWLQRH